MSPYRSPSTYVTGYVPAAPPPGFQLADFLRILETRRGLILRVALAVTGALTLAIGIYPEPFLRLAQTSLH